MMANPIYEVPKKFETMADIADITALLSAYDSARNRLDTTATDEQARKKIAEMQCKDVVVLANTAPRPGEQGIPLSDVSMPRLYRTLVDIKSHLEAKIAMEELKQLGDKG